MIPADAIEGAKQAVLLEMSDRRLLNDVDDDLHDEIATAIVAAALGDGVVVPREPTAEMISAGESAAKVGIGKCEDDEAMPRVYRAMLQAAPSVLTAPASVWKPIESAPKDGTPILLFEREELEAFVGYWATDRFLPLASSWETMPTHWMPLPLPPKAEIGTTTDNRPRNLNTEQ